MTLQTLDPKLTGQLRQALQAGLATPDDPGPRLLQPAAATPTAPQLLSRSHASPREKHAAQALYTRCLRHFRQKVQANLEQDDAALAAACFVLACLAALRDVKTGTAELALVERQMRHRMGQSAAWMQAPLAERQTAFEQFALLGVLVGESAWAARQQGRAALQHVQTAARGYLMQLLGLDADDLNLGPAGLVVELAAA